MNTTHHEPMMSPAPLKSAAEADALVAQLMGVMAELADVLREETEHVRAGRVRAACALARTAKIWRLRSKTTRFQTGSFRASRRPRDGISSFRTA